MFDGVTIEELAAGRRDIDAREGAWLAKLAVYDRSGRWADDGYVSAANALVQVCNMDRGRARSHVDTARKLQRLEAVRAALAAGEISRDHALVIARAHTLVRGEAIEALQDELVDVAKVAPPRGLREVVDRVTDAIDGDDGADADDARYRRRRLSAAPSLDGMVFVEGMGDPEGGAVVLTALQAEMDRDLQARDPRGAEPRRWDALVNICRRSLDRGDMGTSRSVRPHVLAVVDIADYEGCKPLVVAEIRSELAHVGRVSRAALERLVCDCDLTRIVMDGPSQVLDVGQATRTWPAPIAKAIIARDRHCQGDGCQRPWYDCQIHHKQHVPHGGPTSVDNGELLCPACHKQRHAKQHLDRQRAGP